MEPFEVDNDDVDDEVFRQAETSLDLPDVPIAGTKTLEEIRSEKERHDFIDTIRTDTDFTGRVDPRIYRHLSRDKEGYFYYNHKRVSADPSKGGGRLLSVKTLQRNHDTREFLRLAGYKQAPGQELEREMQTVNPVQAEAIKSKIESFKITEDWAKKEKEKAIRELQNTVDETEKQKLQEKIQAYDQLEIQARRRYKDVTQNQFKRISEIINDETRPLLERLRELFRRDGLTIGALITALGMIISTIFLAVQPTPTATPPKQPDKNTFKDRVKRQLVKIANWLLGLAKKALVSLPGILGGLVSFLFKKAGELVLFFSEHLIILLLAVIVFAVEITRKKVLKTA